MISDDLGVIFEVFVKLSQKKIHCGGYKIDHGCPCLVCLHFIEITLYRSGFLEYNLTRVNSVPHGGPWWILYFLCSQRHDVLAPWVAMISAFIVLTNLFLNTPVLEPDSTIFKRLNIWQNCCDGRIMKLIAVIIVHIPSHYQQNLKFCTLILNNKFIQM